MKELTFFFIVVLFVYTEHGYFSAYKRPGQTVLDGGKRECAEVLKDFYFQVFFFFFFTPTFPKVLLSSECECFVSRGLCVYVPSFPLSLMSPLGHTTTICHRLHDLRFGFTNILWLKQHIHMFIFIICSFSISLDQVGQCWNGSAAMYACR